MKSFSIAIDGPAGAGKSTIAKALAQNLGCIYVDTGAMYRTVAYYCMQHGYDYNDENVVTTIMPQIYIDMTYENGLQKIYLNKDDITDCIRTDEVAKGASKVATYGAVRTALVKRQQAFEKEKSLVMDGRDIGTVVLPHATLKVFLSATPQERAQRRFKEYLEKGMEADKDAILKEIEARDYQDYNRKISPLKCAKDAIKIDSSHLTIEEVVEQIKAYLEEKLSESPRKVILAKSAGFCFGVERAVKLAFDTPGNNYTYTLGPIIHNDAVVETLKREKGISPLDSLEGQYVDTLIIRSHGVGKAVYDIANEKNIRLIDATCPYVSKIHRLVAKYQKEGYQIIVIGDSKHPEIIGINGWGQENCLIVKDVRDERLLHLDAKASYLVVAQTTYKEAVVEEVCKLLEANHINFKYVHTICDATTKRQQEAVDIAKKVEVMLVIGSKYSSNTQKLYELCKKECDATYCIDNATELKLNSLKNAKVIGVTAGASTPQNIIDGVIRLIEEV